MKISQVYLNQSQICQDVVNQLDTPLISLEHYGSKLWQIAETNLTFAIYQNDTPIAFLIAKNQGKQALEIISMAVNVTEQKKGLGKDLLKKLEDYAAEHERSYLLCKVPSSYQNYFEKQGFAVLMEDETPYSLYLKELDVEERTDIAYEGDIY